VTDQDLRAIEEIKQLKARYCRFLDTKDWAGYRRLFTDDALIESSRVFASIDEFVTGLSAAMTPTISTHHVHSPEIVLTGEHSARGIWAMFDRVEFLETRDDGSRGIVGYGHYQEEYRRDGGEWRISRLRLSRLHVHVIEEPPPAHVPPGWQTMIPDWLEQTPGP
jgi:hypothetical protein